MVMNQYEGMIAHGVGGHVIGLAITRDGIEPMADTRVLVLPSDWSTQLIGNSEPAGHAAKDEQRGLEVHTQVDLMVREGVAITYSNQHKSATVWVPHASEDWFRDWQIRWTERIRVERATFYPDIWVIASDANCRSVVFVAPH